MDKNSFRTHCLKCMRRRATRCRSAAAGKISDTILQIVRQMRPRSILLYLPMPHEVDIRPLFRPLRGRYRLFVPLMEGESFKVVQFRLPLKKRRYGIDEPNNSLFAFTKIDLAVVPVLGVDGRFGRVGFGKGMYDRYFATLRHRPTVIFVQSTLCYTSEIVTDKYDIVADYYLTPEATLLRGKRYGYRISHRGCGCRH